MKHKFYPSYIAMIGPSPGLIRDISPAEMLFEDGSAFGNAGLTLRHDMVFGDIPEIESRPRPSVVVTTPTRPSYVEKAFVGDFLEVGDADSTGFPG